MGKKLQKYLDEAEKTEQQIAELEERLKTIRAAQKKEEDSEIIRAIRSTKMGGRELLALLDNIQAGNVTFLTAVNNASEEAETEEAIEKDVRCSCVRTSLAKIGNTDHKKWFVAECFS